MKRRLILLACACGLAGLILGAVWPPPPIPRARTAATEWALPDPAQLARHSADDVSQITRAVRWSGESGAEGGARVSWRLAGFVNDPEVAALIMPQARPAPPPAPGTRRNPAPGGAPAGGAIAQAERAVAGDTLPDGSKLVAIEGDTITTELDGCRLVYQLYRPEPVSASPTCAETTATAEPRKTE